MADNPHSNPESVEVLSPTVETHLLGSVDYERFLRLQQQLVDQIADRSDGQIRLLICEHPKIVTIGRAGSPTQVQCSAHLLRSRQLNVRWVKRGGGCLVHAPGQLAVYPIVPLNWHGFSVGEFLERFQAGITETLHELGVPAKTRPNEFGVWGRTGKLVAFGVAVRKWVTFHGAFINVCPPMGLFKLVDDGLKNNLNDEAERTSCILAERRQAIKMTTIRAALIRHITESFGCERYHLYTGHPFL